MIVEYYRIATLPTGQKLAWKVAGEFLGRRHFINLVNHWNNGQFKGAPIKWKYTEQAPIGVDIQETSGIIDHTSERMDLACS